MRIDERFVPLVVARAMVSAYGRVERGQVRGMRMTARGYVEASRGRSPEERVELDLTIALRAPTRDEVIVEGDPPIRVRSHSGFPGDSSTVGVLVSCVRAAPGLAPGLRTMLDVLKLRAAGI